MARQWWRGESAAVGLGAAAAGPESASIRGERDPGVEAAEAAAALEPTPAQATLPLLAQSYQSEAEAKNALIHSPLAC